MQVLSILVYQFTTRRGRKVLQDLNNQNDDRINTLEESLKTTSEGADESERKFDEVGRALPAPPHLTLVVRCGS